MRCPKCHYLSFEPEPRCRNCGYGFSLSTADQPAEPVANEPLADLMLRLHDEGPASRGAVLSTAGPLDAPLERPASVPPLTARRTSDVVADSPALGAIVPPRVEAAPAPARRPSPPARPAAPPTTELPLFVKDMSVTPDLTSDDVTSDEEASDEPLITLPAEPRPPLAVRRSVAESTPPRRTPAAPRKLGPLDRDLLEDLQRIEKTERRDAAVEARAAARELADASGQAGAGVRLAAAAIDAVLLGVLSVSLLWITLRWCDLSLAQAAVLPAWALITFLLIVDVGYLLLFTAAGGQTLGKMLLKIRVIGDPADPVSEPLTISQAACRALLTVPSVLVLGAGFVPALMGEHRALHDRLAHTRVVRS